MLHDTINAAAADFIAAITRAGVGTSWQTVTRIPSVRSQLITTHEAGSHQNQGQFRNETTQPISTVRGCH